VTCSIEQASVPFSRGASASNRPERVLIKVERFTASSLAILAFHSRRQSNFAECCARWVGGIVVSFDKLLELGRRRRLGPVFSGCGGHEIVGSRHPRSAPSPLMMSFILSSGAYLAVS
jgi:hypothetical protein